MKALIAKTSILSAVIMIMILVGLPLLSSAVNDQRQAEVVERGKDIMPFNLKATTHVFTKTPEGGIQRVMVKDLSDVSQTKLVREHLRAINQQFLNGDFSGPSHIHGQDMPGLAELDSAKPGQIVIDYREVEGGGELEYKTADATMVVALRQWFDAQLSDHSTDAMEGHQHHDGDMSQ